MLLLSFSSIIIPMSNIPIELSKQCGAYKCGKWFIPKNPVDSGAIMLICPACEERINEGIVINLHNKTGKIKGNWHEIDGYREE